MHGIFFNPPIEQHYIPHIMEEIFKQRVYDPYFIGKQDLTVLDIGANIGLFSYYAKDFATKVYALEPSNTHFETLQYMVAFNDLKNIQPVKLALSNGNGHATFYHNPNVTMHSLSQEVADPEAGTEEVETVTIEQLFNLLSIDHVDFMKLDVEGEEQNIIGGESFKNICHKIDTIMGENHAWNGRNPEQLATTLRDRGFSFEWLPNTDAQIFLARRNRE